MKFVPLPFFNDRESEIDMLVFHCSAQHTMEMIDVLRESQLSCHYIVDTDGSVTQLVADDKRAWHGGAGSWREVTDSINSHSIGIELSSPSLGQAPYPAMQINALIRLCRGLIAKYHIPSQNIIGHSDSAPTRKPDPGKAFPWQKLAQKGIGLWYDLQDAANAPTDNLKQLLSGIGYRTETEEDFSAAQYAFARHFLPDLVTTDADIYHLIRHVFPENVDFTTNEKLITTAQAVYMRFNS